ncbi:DUF1003 domain-containing protein [Lacisediminihabitans profunda]|nr:DUF1003 domain-containing protein [Lacisediminihabitans profunda]
MPSTSSTRNTPTAPRQAATEGLTTTPSPLRDWHADHKSHLTRGERAADLMRNGMGSWAFVGGFVAFMIVWAIINTVTKGWDPYPFILLNLFLSMLAGLQGAILLIAAKRQDAIAAALSKHDYNTNVAAKKDIEAVLEINKRQLLMIADLQEILGRLDPAGTKKS